MRTSLTISLLALVLFTLGRCQRERERPPGERLAAVHCASCHLEPKPNQLNREIWVTEVLPHMAALRGIYLGKSRQDYLKGAKEAPYLEAVYPTAPQIPQSVWDTLFQYFVAEAPDRLPPPTTEGEEIPLLYEMDRFIPLEVRDTSSDALPGLVTAIAVDEDRGEVRVASLLEGSGAVRHFGADHRLRLSGPGPGIQANLRPDTEGQLTMGSLIPSDVPKGRFMSPTDTLNGLIRPLDFLYWDADQDGSPELIIAEYGNMTGRLSLYQGSERTILSPTPGALRLRRGDLDEDGHEDLIVLFAQGDERIEVWFSRPGKPERKRLYRFPPSYGSSDLQLADLDGDGDLDLVHTCGDNYDYQPIPKPYHGIRILLNDGNGDFSETWFYHMDGAYGAEVDDFDGDGDADIAAIAYFIPPAKRALHSFVYLEQTAPLQFKAQGFKKNRDQHFICMDKGDLDGDGDVDLVLGNFAGYLPDGMPSTRRNGRTEVVYVYLENRTAGLVD